MRRLLGDSIDKYIIEEGVGPHGEPLVVGYIDKKGRRHLYEGEVESSAYSVLQDTALPPLPEGRSRRFFTIEQLGQPHPIDWIVKDWIAAGELSVIYGPGDSYKSFLALHWGLLAAEAKRQVVYIAGEGAHGLRTRVPAWMKHNNMTEEELSTFRVDELPVELNSPSERSAWLAEIEDELSRRPDWVIVDTLSMCFTGDESSPQDMNSFVKGCEEIRRGPDHRTALTVIHHTTKKGEAERGTGALRNSTFSMIRLSGKTPNGFSVLVECDRMKDAAKPEPQRMRLEKIEWDRISSLAVDSFSEAKVEVQNRDATRERKK